MKELINAVVLLVGLWGGTLAIDKLYVAVREAALVKSSKGLPSLVDLNNKLHQTHH